MQISKYCVVLVVLVLFGLLGANGENRKNKNNRDPLSRKQMKYLRRLLRLQGSRKPYGKAFVIKGDEHSTPALSISANNEVLFSGALDMNTEQEQELPLRHRSARSVSFKNNIPMISSKVVRKHQEQERNSQPDQDTGAHQQMENNPQNEGPFSSQGQPMVGPMSVSETIPTHAGVTKVDINLTFGCLFFCE